MTLEREEKRSDEMDVECEQNMCQFLLSTSSLCGILFSRNLVFLKKPGDFGIPKKKKAFGLGSASSI